MVGHPGFWCFLLSFRICVEFFGFQFSLCFDEMNPWIGWVEYDHTVRESKELTFKRILECKRLAEAQQFNIFSRFKTNFMIFVVLLQLLHQHLSKGWFFCWLNTTESYRSPSDLSLPGPAGSLFLLAAFPCCAPREDQPHDRGRDPRAQVSPVSTENPRRNPTGIVVSTTQEW